MSLVLHVGLAAWLATRKVPPPPPAQSKPIELQIVELPPPEPPPAPKAEAAAEEPATVAKAAPKSAPKTAPAPVRKQRVAEAAPQPKAAPHQATETRPTAEARPLSRAPEQQADSSAEAPLAGNTAPVPKLNLMPSDNVLGGIPVPAAPGSSGHTIRNDGSAPTGPSKEELAEEARQKINGMARSLIATRRVQAGAVDYYFHDLRNSLEKHVSFELPLAVDVKKGVLSAIESYKETLAQYGKTGSPNAVVGQSDLDTVNENSPNGTAGARTGVMDQTARMKKLLQDAYGADPVVIVEIRQTHEGKYLDSRILETSGNRTFEEQVMAMVPTGVGAAPIVPDRLQAQHPVEIRTVWEFRGHYILHKKLKQVKISNPGDAAYMVAMGAATLLSGAPFDETTGDVYMLDMAHPEFHITPKLLQLY